MDAMTAGRVMAGLNLLVRSEETVARFYRECARAWPPQTDFWGGLAEEEMYHAAVLELMRRRVAEAPERFCPRREFAAPAIETFMSGVRRATALVCAKRIDSRRALLMARDLERALLEQRSFEVATACDRTYREYVAELEADTHRHARQIESRIAALSGATAMAGVRAGEGG